MASYEEARQAEDNLALDWLIARLPYGATDEAYVVRYVNGPNDITVIWG